MAKISAETCWAGGEKLAAMGGFRGRGGHSILGFEQLNGSAAPYTGGYTTSLDNG